VQIAAGPGASPGHVFVVELNARRAAVIVPARETSPTSAPARGRE
jgi:hypothetical protein